MTEITLNEVRYLFVEIPPHEGLSWEIYEKDCLPLAVLFTRSGWPPVCEVVVIPSPGSWSILGTVKECLDDEGKARDVVEEDDFWGEGETNYKEYMGGFPLTMPSDSLHSLLTAHSINENCLILKQIK